MIPNSGREVRGLLRTRDGQTTVCRDGESLLNHITTGRQKKKHRKDRQTQKKGDKKRETANPDDYILVVSTDDVLKMLSTI